MGCEIGGTRLLAGAADGPAEVDGLAAADGAAGAKETPPLPLVEVVVVVVGADEGAEEADGPPACDVLAAAAAGGTDVELDGPDDTAD